MMPYKIMLMAFALLIGLFVPAAYAQVLKDGFPPQPKTRENIPSPPRYGPPAPQQDEKTEQRSDDKMRDDGCPVHFDWIS